MRRAATSMRRRWRSLGVSSFFSAPAACPILVTDRPVGTYRAAGSYRGTRAAVKRKRTAATSPRYRPAVTALARAVASAARARLGAVADAVPAADVARLGRAGSALRRIASDGIRPAEAAAEARSGLSGLAPRAVGRARDAVLAAAGLAHAVAASAAAAHTVGGTAGACLGSVAHAVRAARAVDLAGRRADGGSGAATTRRPREIPAVTLLARVDNAVAAARR